MLRAPCARRARRVVRTRSPQLGRWRNDVSALELGKRLGAALGPSGSQVDAAQFFAAPMSNGSIQFNELDLLLLQQREYGAGNRE